MKTPPVPTGSFNDLVQSRIESDPAFRAELLQEGMGETTSLGKPSSKQLTACTGSGS